MNWTDMGAARRFLDAGPGTAVASALMVLMLGLGPWARPASAQALTGYTPCLGCAEHTAIQMRWHRPFLLELAGEGVAMAAHFQVEQEAANLGLCETDLLTRSALAINGCHKFSATRAWLIEAPIEVAAFTSPAWGLARRGHGRWAMLLEMVPLAYHIFAAEQTVHAIHTWKAQVALYK